MSFGVARVVARVAVPARSVAHRAYHRLAAINYDREWLVRENRTPAGSFRCYEPLNRHGGDEMLAELDDACGSDAVVFDVGANVGIYALALASDEPGRRIIAFEPSPPTVDRLVATVRLNGLDDRIDVRPHGIGEEDGDRPFYRSSNAELSAFDRESATRWGATVVDIRRVPVRSLDGLVCAREDETERDREPLPAPDAVKVDVEGAAPAVLRGARELLARYRPLVFVEIHEDGLDRDAPGETRAVLNSCGYRVRERAGYWRCDPLK
ncbi:FkbM family methyltransferase [Natrialbaceae archaeon A-arb3/5]